MPYKDTIYDVINRTAAKDFFRNAYYGLPAFSHYSECRNFLIRGNELRCVLISERGVKHFGLKAPKDIRVLGWPRSAGPMNIFSLPDGIVFSEEFKLAFHELQTEWEKVPKEPVGKSRGGYVSPSDVFFYPHINGALRECLEGKRSQKDLAQQ